MAAELFGPADVPKIVGLPDLRSINLTAEEGFLLSRIDGRTNVRGLLALVSWDQAKTFDLLESLRKKHLVNFDRPEIYERGTGSSGSGPSPDVVSGNGSAAAASPRVAATGPAIDRSTIEKVPDLEEERCVEILEWERRVQHASSLYELFGLPDGADVRSVKREYRHLAMKYHPDKFFRKEIGGYRGRIDEAWKRIQEAYERLTDPALKATYDAEVLSRGGSSPRPTLAPQAAPSQPAAADPRPWMAPPAPPSPSPMSSTDDRSSSPSQPAAPLPTVPNPEPRPKMESAFERKIRQEVRERVEKAQRHFEQAQLDFKDKKYVAADSNIKLALQFDPKNEDFLKWHDSVKATLEESIVGTILRRGELAELSHDTKAAQEAYEHALSIFPENGSVNRVLGLLLLAKGDPNLKRIKDCLTKATTAKPKDVDALVGLAKTLRLMGMIKNAQRILEQAREIDSKHAGVAEEVKEQKKVK